MGVVVCGGGTWPDSSGPEGVAALVCLGKAGVSPSGVRAPVWALGLGAQYESWAGTLWGLEEWA